MTEIIVQKSYRWKCSLSSSITTPERICTGKTQVSTPNSTGMITTLSGLEILIGCQSSSAMELTRSMDRLDMRERDRRRMLDCI